MLLIFDMDGVLIDSERHWRSIEADFLRGLIPSWSEVDQRGILGMSLRDVYRRLGADYGLEITWDEYLRHYNELGAHIYGKLANLTPGVTELAEIVRSTGGQCAVASSSPRHWIDLVLRRHALTEVLTYVASSDDVHGVGKPDPAVYRHCLNIAGVPAELSLAIEDSDKGLRSARGAGIFPIGFRNGVNAHQTFVDASHEIRALTELNTQSIAELLRRHGAGGLAQS